MSDLPLDDILDPPAGTNPAGTDPEQAYDGGWEQDMEEGEGFEDHLLGEKPVVPEL